MSDELGDPFVGFDEGDVDPRKGFEGTSVQSLDDWNMKAFEAARRASAEDPFERKPQRIKRSTRVKLWFKNKNRSRKLGVDV